MRIIAVKFKIHNPLHFATGYYLKLYVNFCYFILISDSVSVFKPSVFIKTL